MPFGISRSSKINFSLSLDWGFQSKFNNSRHLPGAVCIVPMPPLENNRWFSETVQPHEPALRVYLSKRFPSLPDHEDYSNPEAVARRVELRDGSIIHLNTGSELRVDFSARERCVRLQSGEAYFEVAHDASRPFVVLAGGVVVRAIGTAFNVRLASANVEVLVEEGRVEVAPVVAARVAAGAPAPAAPQLGAGERTQVPRADAIEPPQIERVERRELREALAWHRQTVVLADIALEDVIARFNRRNEIQLVLADAELRGRRVGGMLFLDQVEAFVALLEQGGDIVAERRGFNEIVLRRAR